MFRRCDRSVHLIRGSGFEPGGPAACPSIATLVLVALLGIPVAECAPQEDGIAPEPQPAGDPDHRAADESRLQRLQNEIAELRVHILQAESRAGSLVGQLDEIDLNIALLHREAEALARRADNAERAHVLT